MPDARLADLASRCNIDLGYHDVWGKWHDAPERTLRLLLAALGVRAEDDSAVESSLQEFERDRWQLILPAAIVIQRDALVQGARIQLRCALDGRELAWRVTEENGHAQAGQFMPEALSSVEQASVDGESFRAALLPLPGELSFGYHRIALFDQDKRIAEAALIVVPSRCYQPEAIARGGRVWGGALQLYGVRSERNWGIGDFTDLRLYIDQWAARGASLIGMNPLHALFLHNPAHVSPYSPSSRLFLNVLYLDVEAIEEFRTASAARELANSVAFRAELKSLRDAELVDHVAVAAVKRPVLEMLYAHFNEHELRGGTRRARAFRNYCAGRGNALRHYALFEALQEYMHREQPGIGGWQEWPEPFRDPRSSAVTEFAEAHVSRVQFFEYLQWQADEQIAAAEALCFERGLGIGLYTDLAISIDRSGADAWANQDVYALTASVGAPPDAFNIPGQNWGLPPLVPTRLREAAYAPLIATLGANMTRAGALRIDHVMGLARLFWVLPGMEPAQGTYVRYPFADILGIVALESHRHRCLVIGEDLGTVPDEVRAALHDAGVLSYRLLIFERDSAGHFLPPDRYPAQALAACSTHDLPTLAGYWHGQDLHARAALGLFPTNEVREQQVLARAQERAALLLALEHEGLLPAGVSVDPASMPEMTPEFIVALHIYLARTPAAIMIAQAEDVLGVIEQPNLPGTVDQHPNWRRKLPLTLEQWSDDARFRRITDAISGLRGQRSLPRPRPSRQLTGASIPRATYRLQLHSKFTFRDATQLVPYLSSLGISHVYCSPYLRARSGSTHGYDIIDHQALNPEIGTRAQFDEFVAALHAHGMNQIMDIVPNHMGVMGADNAWWLEVLENGQASQYADFFDIDWQPVSADLANRVLLPVLGNHYGSVLAAGELSLGFDAPTGSFSIHYYDHRFPIDPREYPRVLDRAAATLTPADVAADALAEFKSLVSAFGYLPARDERAPERIAERATNKEVHKRRLAQLATEQTPIMEAIRAGVRTFNGRKDDAASFDDLHALLEAQAYRLSYWRVASDEINYRRFFDINDLAALRMENETVFDATHRFAFELVREGAVEGLRIDHPDGLFDPAAYFKRLQDTYRQMAALHNNPMSEEEQRRPLYVVVEKIIAPFEHVPETWPIYGSTGYRFANVVNDLFVDSAAEARFTRIYHAFIGDKVTFEAVANRAKHSILRTALASELTVLANRLFRIARADRTTRDYTLNTLRQALAEIIAWFPVYRTYIADEVRPDDRRYIEWAVAKAKRHTRAADSSIFEFVKSTLLCETSNPALLADVNYFARKFQQVTAPVTAKGVEDTSFYIYNRLVSLNDVGGDPTAFGYSVAGFHGASADRAAKWPHTMIATSTHDNKRSADVRARINVLSEMSAAWRLQLRRWSRMNRRRKRIIDDLPAPTPNDEYLLYQTLIGSFPLGPTTGPELQAYCARIEQYMLKAVREAKVNTSWLNPNEDYEQAVVQFVRGLLSETEHNLFLDDFRASIVPLSWLGMLNSLSVCLITLTSPGVPDTYQGSELWDFSLVDPDNRRPVDYEQREALLAQLTSMATDARRLKQRVRRLVENMPDGRVKLYVISRLLLLRREHAELFRYGSYTPLPVSGKRAAHVVAYAREYGNGGAITVAGRLFAGLGTGAGELPCGEKAWGDTRLELPSGAKGVALRNVLTNGAHTATDGAVSVGELFADFPGAVLSYER